MIQRNLKVTVAIRTQLYRPHRAASSHQDTLMLTSNKQLSACLSESTQWPCRRWMHTLSWPRSQAAQSRCTVVKMNRKMVNSTPCKIVTPKIFNLKLCTRDYVGEATHHANFGFNRYSRGVSPYRRNITTLWLFLLTVLSCPVLSCPFFFSGTRPGRTAEPIFTLYGSNDVFPRKEVPFGG